MDTLDDAIQVCYESNLTENRVRINSSSSQSHSIHVLVVHVHVKVMQTRPTLHGKQSRLNAGLYHGKEVAHLSLNKGHWYVDR